MQRGKHAGRLVAPINYGYGGNTAPGVVYSDDHGKTWKVGGICKPNPRTLLVEARGVELCDGSLLFNCRTVNKLRGITVLPEGGSKDTTKFWYAKDLPDPSCQGAVARHSWPKHGKPGLILYRMFQPTFAVTV